MSLVRLPVAVDLTDRERAAGLGALYTTDTLLINCYIEHEDGRLYVAKRPGLTIFTNYDGGAATNGQGTVFYKGALYAVGSNVLYRLSGAAVNSSADGTAWTASTSAPWAGRVGHQTIMFNGQILVIGGDVGGLSVVANDVWASSDAVNWQQLTAAAPWTGRRNHAAVVIGSTLYIMGGTNFGAGSTVFNDVWSTTDGVAWTQVVASAPWIGRWGLQVVPFNQGMILMGGKDSSGTLYDDVWFSTDGSTWTQLAVNATWSARYLFGALVFNSKMWVIGGHDGTGTVATVYSSSDGINWTNTGSLPAAREWASYCVYAGKMWIIGGKTGASITSTVYATSDGVTFTTPSANYGGGAIEGSAAIAWPTPTSVNSINALTIWLIGGDVVTGNQVYRATVNVARPSSFSPSTGASSTEQWQTTTQNLGQYLLLKNTVDAWVLTAGTLQKISSPNYPTVTVSGIVNLDDTVYVMEPDGTISGSNLSDPFTWSANNFIVADYESDTAVCLAKYGEYVVAFKSTTLQMFYDAGRFPGSPLLPVLSANQRIGCASAGSVVSMDNTLVFMATTGAGDRYIGVLAGQSVQKISTPAIDRILLAWTPDAFAYGQNIKLNGHDFYVLTLKTNLVTIAYDFVEQRWHTWQSSTTTGNYFTAINAVTDGVSVYAQDIAVGTLYKFDPTTYQDFTNAINVSLTLSKYDNGNNKKKFCASATIIGDRISASSPNTATLKWSDDDQNSFNTGFTVDLTTENPTVNRLGSFYRRVFRILHSDDNPMRLEALELDLIEG